MANDSVTVLCVEDDPDIRQIVRLSLGLDPGFALIEASSACEARRLLATADGRIDVALLDCGLPDGDGCAMAGSFRDDYPALPVILFTAACRRADVDRYRASGAAGIIAKPFDPLGLSHHIRAALTEVNDFYTAV